MRPWWEAQYKAMSLPQLQRELEFLRGSIFCDKKKRDRENFIQREIALKQGRVAHGKEQFPDGAEAA